MHTWSSPPATKLVVVSIVAVALVAVVVWAVTTRGDDDARVSTVQDARIQSVLSACAAPDGGLRSPGVGVLDISYPGGEPTDAFTTALDCVFGTVAA